MVSTLVDERVVYDPLKRIARNGCLEHSREQWGEIYKLNRPCTVSCHLGYINRIWKVSICNHATNSGLRASTTLLRNTYWTVRLFSFNFRTKSSDDSPIGVAFNGNNSIAKVELRPSGLESCSGWTREGAIAHVLHDSGVAYLGVLFPKRGISSRKP